MATIVSEPSSNRVFQRSASSGGLFDKGQGSAEFNITTAAALLEYRIVDASSQVAVGPWVSAGAGGVFTVAVPANNQWYLLELREDGGSNSYTNNRFGAGGITLMYGQSLALRLFVNVNNPLNSLAALGITPSDFAVMFGTYANDDPPDVTVPAWLNVADSTAFDSAFVQFLNDKVTREGVLWCLAGHAYGSAIIQNFLSTGSQWSSVTQIIDGIGDTWEEFFWFQGHSNADLGNETTQAAYEAFLDTLFSDINGYASFSGYPIYMITICNLDGIGALLDVDAIRKAGNNWCGLNGATYIQPHDIDLVDPVHQSNPGSVSFARHLFRAQYSRYWGPRLVGVERVGASITLQFQFTGGGNLFAAAGSALNLFDVSLLSDEFTLLTKSSVTINATTVDIELAADPGTDELRFWVAENNTLDGSDYIADNYTADGFTRGRLALPSLGEIAQVQSLKNFSIGRSMHRSIGYSLNR